MWLVGLIAEITKLIMFYNVSNKFVLTLMGVVHVVTYKHALLG